MEIADTLLIDKDDLVQKGYGWMLKAASEANQQEIFNYVIKNKFIMPRIALRYAIEKMPKDLKSKQWKSNFKTIDYYDKKARRHKIYAPGKPSFTQYPLQGTFRSADTIIDSVKVFLIFLLANPAAKFKVTGPVRSAASELAGIQGIH